MAHMGAQCCGGFEAAAPPPALGGASLGGTPVLGPPQGQEVPVKLLRVYDGDTVTLAFVCGQAVFQDACRLAGIDAPEMKPRLSSASRAEEKQAAVAARDALAGLLAAGPLFAVFRGREKYGRWLVTLRVAGVEADAGEWMVRQGFAVPYHGGAKAGFRRQQPAT